MAGGDVFDQATAPKGGDLFDQIAPTQARPAWQPPDAVQQARKTIAGIIPREEIQRQPTLARGAPVQSQESDIPLMPSLLALQIPGMAAAPVSTGLSLLGTLGGGIAGKYIAQGGAGLLGASPETKQTAGKVGEIAGGIGGGLIGGVAGIPSVARLIGKKVYLPSGELSSWAEALTHPTKIPETVLRKLIPEQPTFPGGSLPSKEEFYAQRGADLMKRGAQQATLDRQAAAAARVAAKNALPPDQFVGMTSSATPIGNAPLPEVSEAAQQPQIQMVSKLSSAPAKSKIVLPGSQPPDIKVTYQSYPREKLYDMAKMGNIDAGRELLRNPKGFELPPNFKFLIEEGAKLKPWRNLKE